MNMPPTPPRAPPPQGPGCASEHKRSQSGSGGQPNEHAPGKARSQVKATSAGRRAVSPPPRPSAAATCPRESPVRATVATGRSPRIRPSLVREAPRVGRLSSSLGQGEVGFALLERANRGALFRGNTSCRHHGRNLTLGVPARLMKPTVAYLPYGVCTRGKCEAGPHFSGCPVSRPVVSTRVDWRLLKPALTTSRDPGLKEPFREPHLRRRAVCGCAWDGRARACAWGGWGRAGRERKAQRRT